MLPPSGTTATHLLLTHDSLDPHVPQEIVPPHPSPAVPQFKPVAHVVAGVQPHTPLVPLPPQVCGEVQLPQEIAPPQPSGAVPQL